MKKEFLIALCAVVGALLGACDGRAQPERKCAVEHVCEDECRQLKRAAAPVCEEVAKDLGDLRKSVAIENLDTTKDRLRDMTPRIDLCVGRQNGFSRQAVDGSVQDVKDKIDTVLELVKTAAKHFMEE